MDNEKNAPSLRDRLTSKFNTASLQSFFMGRYYPLTVAALVLLGHTFGIEIYLCLVNMILFASAMVTCTSVRPLIIALCTFTWQVPLKHTPGGPVWSNHYLSGPGPWLLGLSVIIIVSTFVYIFIKHKIFKGLSFRDTPLLLSTLILSAAFLLNGAFSSTWEPSDLLYGALQAILFPLLFLVFYKGLKEENDLGGLCLYVSYVAAVMGVLFSLEIADLYIFGNDYYGTLFSESGAVIKERIHLGWATWNPAGISAAVLIPAIFYGTVKGKHPFAYFACACITYVAALLTFSRNTILASSAAFVACILIACFFGDPKRKKAFRITVGSALLAVVFFVIVFWSEITVFAKDIFDRGLSDNGRFAVWNVAVSNFKSKPVFGTGFYYFYSPILYNYSFMPLMAHQTFLQLLSSMGLVGLGAYVFYRIDTAGIFFKKPTFEKSMLGLCISVLLCGSMLDNFIFTVFPLFFYSVALAVAALISDAQREEELMIKKAKRKARRKRK